MTKKERFEKVIAYFKENQPVMELFFGPFGCRMKSKELNCLRRPGGSLK